MANPQPRGGLQSPHDAHLYPSSEYTDDPTASPPPPPAHRQFRPGMHPQSNFQRMQEERQYGAASSQSNYDLRIDRALSQSPPVARRPVGGSISHPPPPREMSPSPPMHPGMPTFALPNARSPYQDPGNPYSSPVHREEQYSPPGGHNYAPAAAAAGGAAIGMGAGAAAMGMSDRQQAFSPPGNMGSYAHMAGPGQPPPDPIDHGFDGGGGPYRNAVQSHESYGSEAPLAAAAIPPAIGTPGYPEPSYRGYSDHSPSPVRLAAPYADTPLPPHSRSHEQVNDMAYVDPNAIIDDGDEDFLHNSKRASKISLPFNKSKTSVGGLPLVGAGAGAGAGAIGDNVTGNVFARGDPSGNYGPVPASRMELPDQSLEKNVWLRDNKASNAKRKKILFIVLGVLIILGIAGGAVGGILSRNKPSSNSSNGGQSAQQDDSKGDLSKDSSEIKKLMNNPNLHKVFSGFAYTPFAAQYPDCLTNPPSQNNVTRDMAMIGQLTNVVRLYGTDCNQTEMVLHAIDRLALTDMKVWVGVWLGNNKTTNTRQVDQMWKILDNYGTKYVKGVVVGNEVLFRKDLTPTELGNYLSQTKKNLTAKGINLPVATSDLGDNWTASLATEVDVVMSNVHPFFGGVAIDQAASWTYSFWQSHDVAVTQGMTNKKHIISEFGWPSAGGNDCAPASTCPDKTSGAVAGIDNMNKLMSDWVCQALTNGTDYFWFEAFDEPWKIQYNTPSQQWEDKWGLMDINRNLKKGLQIPTCGGKTAPS